MVQSANALYTVYSSLHSLLLSLPLDIWRKMGRQSHTLFLVYQNCWLHHNIPDHWQYPYMPNIVTSVKDASTTITQLPQDRADPEGLFDSAVEIRETFEIEASRPRKDGRQRHRPRANTGWGQYLPFVNHLLQEMVTRLLVAQNHYVAKYLTPRQRWIWH